MIYVSTSILTGVFLFEINQCGVAINYYQNCYGNITISCFYIDLGMYSHPGADT